MPAITSNTMKAFKKPERKAASDAAGSVSTPMGLISWWYSKPNTLASSGTMMSMSSKKLPRPVSR